MKSSKNSRNQYGNSERQKSGKRTEKTTKYSLDRKSSRGMIYENEELRLRTININAEVERGQSDIKRLRRENEQLRREIWTLRDECDRLNKRFKANHGSCNARCSGGSSGSHKRRSSGAGHGACHSASNSDDSDSCDTCRGDDQCSDDCCTDSGCIQAAAALQKQEQLAAEYAAEEASPAEGEAAPNNGSSGLLNTFDHLSVVSEETLSNSDLQVPLSDGSYLGSSYNSDLNGSQMTIPSFGPLTPLTPIELVANQLNDLQAVVPPLSYFENIVHQNHMGSTIGTTPETAAGAPRISRHTNGWDYNLESPFAHHGAAAIAAAAAAAASNNSSAYQSNSNSASASSSTNTSSTVIQQKPSAALQPPLQTFSTFVPATSVTPPTAANTPDVVVSNPSKLTAFTHSTTSNQPTITFASPPSTSSPASSSRIETVAITTMPQQRAPVFSEKGKLGRNTAFGEGGGPVNSDATAGAPPPALNSPKHFFSPLKPRLKLNTTLANKNLTAGSAVMVMAPTVPPIPVRPPVAPQPQTYHPPDIYVTNALASPYHRQPVPTIRVGPPLVTKPSSSPPPPPTLTTTLPSPSNGHNQANSMNSPSQVSPRHHRHRHHNHHQHKHHQHHYHNHQHNHHLAAKQPVWELRAQPDKALPMIIVNLVDDISYDWVMAPGDDQMANEEVKEPPFASLTPPRRHVQRKKSFRVDSPGASPTLVPPYREDPQLIYAMARNELEQLISPAVTKPLMATSTTLTSRINLWTETGLSPLGSPTPPRCMTAPPLGTTATSTVTPLTTPRPSPRRVNLTSRMTKVSSRMPPDADEQTDSVNLEAILNDIETISEDILAIQLDKNKSRDNLAAAGQSAEATDSKPLQPQDKTKKPYKSEMNLLLSYEGPNPTITPAQKVEASAAGSATSTIQRRRTRSLEGGDHTDSPSSMPDPMAPFPDNHTYIGFEHLNSAVSGGPETQTTTSLSLPITVPYSSARPPLPPGATPSGNGVGGFVNPKPAIPPKPSPPSRAYPPPLNIRCAGIARTPTAPAGSLERIAPGLSPNKSQLYSSLANAAAKRAIFRSTPTNMTSSLDEEEGAGDRPAIEGDGEATTANATRPEETSPSSDAAQRKAARRVSILCNELGGIVLASPPESQTTATTTATTTDTSNATPSKGDGNQMASAATTTTSGSTTTVLTSANPPLTSGSYNDLTAMNPTLRYLRQMQSYSTPNSPHASRRTMEPSKLAATPGTHNSLPPQTGGGALMTASTLAINQQHQQQRKSSQDSTRGHSGELATAAALVARSRCSRRHSDGTVVGSATQQQQQRNSGGGSHHHGHHHSHQHTHQLASHNPHHSHHSRQDSNHETATSLSDRNSNSLASSRESSTSFSMRSQRRKISVSSHTGGKIPWCGCWGNGCL